MSSLTYTSTDSQVTCGNYTKALNVTGASISTIRNFGPLPPWCQHELCSARLSSKTLTPSDRYYPFYSWGGQNSFVFTWFEFWTWATFCLEVIMIGFQICEIYKVDQVNQRAKNKHFIDNPVEFQKEMDKARGPGMWGTRWIGALYIALGIAEFIYVLAGQYARPGALIFQTGNTILSTQMLIPVLFMANGMMMLWSSFIYRHNYAELLTAKVIVPLLIVINMIIIGFIMLMYTWELNLDSTRTLITWGATLWIASFLPFIFVLVHSKLGWADETGTAQYAIEQSWSDYNHMRLGLAVLWAVGAALMGAQVPGYFICGLINLNDKVIDNMVYIGFIGLYAAILILLYFVYWAVSFDAAVRFAWEVNGKRPGQTEMPCCEVTSDLCCSATASVALFSPSYTSREQRALMPKAMNVKSSSNFTAGGINA